MKTKDLIYNSSICCAMICFMWIFSLFADEYPFEPPKNFKLNPKYIAIHHPVTTPETLAQLYFDQGLTFIYAFNHDAAYWSFLRASEVDPNMAMAYWGMALALGPNINMESSPERSRVAYDSIQKGIQLISKNGLESERDYISALAKRYSNNPKANAKQLALDYSQAMRELSHKYPDDLDATVLFAESILDINPWNQWNSYGKPLEGTMEAVGKLQSVLKRDPNHLGANHYYIHVVEASLHPEMALMAAERLGKLLPSSGHILHMPSHIYMLVGDYLKAALSNEAAVGVDREYIREFGVSGIYPIHYLSHNLYVLSRAYIMLGRFEDALRSANELAAFANPHFKQMPELEYFASAPLTVFIIFHRWKNILEMAKPNDSLQMTLTLWHFGRALAFANLGDISQAIKEQQLFLDEKKKLSSEQAFGYNKAEPILKIAAYCLDAKLAEVQGKTPQALEFLRKAVAEQDTLRYNEPPDWFFPVREMLGGLLLRTRKPAEAEVVFREALNKHPRYGRVLFGLRESLQAQSKLHDLFWINEEFQKAWLYSNISLTINDL